MEPARFGKVIESFGNEYIKNGDIVMLTRYDGTRGCFKDENLRIVDPKKILGIIEGDTQKYEEIN